MVPPSPSTLNAGDLLSGDIATELWSSTGGFDAGMHGEQFEMAAKKGKPKVKSPKPCPTTPDPCTQNPSKKTKK